MNILAIDTSNTSLHICLKKDSLYFGNFRECGLMHATMIMSQIDGLMNEAGLERDALDLVICGYGPGSFTGMRIGLSTAKGLCLALNIPLKCISLLDVYGDDFSFWPGSVIPLVNAKKGRFYGAVYRNGVRTEKYFDAGMEDILNKKKMEYPVLLCGQDSMLFKEKASEKIIVAGTGQTAMGKQLLECGLRKYEASGADELNISPLYIRKSDAEISRQK